VLTFLTRPLGRLTSSGDTEVESAGAEAASAIAGVFVEASRRPILAAKASSTCLASSADKRFLAFRMAMARGCSSPSGNAWISWMSCALEAADASALSFSGTGGAVLVRGWLVSACVGPRPLLSARSGSVVLSPLGPSLATSGASSRFVHGWLSESVAYWLQFGTPSCVKFRCRWADRIVPRRADPARRDVLHRIRMAHPTCRHFRQ
jgi:hypothetical protein